MIHVKYEKHTIEKLAESHINSVDRSHMFM